MDIDLTFAVQFGILLATLLVVGNLLFKPMLNVLELREKSIVGAKADSAALVKQAQDKEEELRLALDNTRRQAMDERASIIAAARAAERQLVESARQSSQQKLDVARQKLQSSQKDIEGKLKTMSQDLGKVVASKILLREV